MRKNRVIGFAAAALMALGLTAGAATTAGAFSGGGDGSDAKPAKQSGRTAPAGKAGSQHGDKPEGVSVQRTKDGVKVRKLTKEEAGHTHGAKPTKPLPGGGTAAEGKSDK